MRRPVQIILWGTLGWLLAPLAAVLWIMAIDVGVALVELVARVGDRVLRWAGL